MSSEVLVYQGKHGACGWRGGKHEVPVDGGMNAVVQGNNAAALDVVGHIEECPEAYDFEKGHNPWGNRNYVGVTAE